MSRKFRRLNEYCSYCGRFLPFGKRKYCCPTCAQKGERHLPKPEKTELSIDSYAEDVKEAAEISYGIWIAKKLLEKEATSC